MRPGPEHPMLRDSPHRDERGRPAGRTRAVRGSVEPRPVDPAQPGAPRADPALLGAGGQRRRSLCSPVWRLLAAEDADFLGALADELDPTDAGAIANAPAPPRCPKSGQELAAGRRSLSARPRRGGAGAGGRAAARRSEQRWRPTCGSAGRRAVSESRSCRLARSGRGAS